MFHIGQVPAEIFIPSSHHPIIPSPFPPSFAVLPRPPPGYNPPMVTADFDLDSLARYLHVTPAQVQKMAERGTLPGRRVGGAWKFPQAEIHHWLEERIGAADDADLAEVEKVLSRAGEHEPSDI